MSKPAFKDQKIEKRAFRATFGIRDGEGHTIYGRPIIYDSVTRMTDFWGDEYDEVIDSGALDNADMRDVRLLVNHAFDRIPVARSRNNNGNSTMMIAVDADGMSFEADLDTERNNEASALYSAVEREDLTGMSFGFSISGQAWERLDEDIPLRRITAIGSVLEISAVTFPAYQQTEISVRDNRPTRSSEDEEEVVTIPSEPEGETPAPEGAALEEQEQTSQEDDLLLELLKFEASYGGMEFEDEGVFGEAASQKAGSG